MTITPQKQEYMKEYRKQNRVAISRYNREWYRKNRERKLAYYEEWYNQNRQRKLMGDREWRKKNPEKYRAQQRRHRLRYPEKIKARNFVNSHDCPLDSECIFCGTTEKLEHGHIDYDYPALYITVCHECNQNMEVFS